MMENKIKKINLGEVAADAGKMRKLCWAKPKTQLLMLWTKMVTDLWI